MERGSEMKSEYSVSSDFDINKHKNTFINYLEVIIHPDGSVHYAVPSHQEYLIKYICKQDGITREELEDSTPVEYYCDFMRWLCMQSGCISVWNKFLCLDQMTDAQRATLEVLKKEDLYKGDIQ